ncbi:MAG TPA: TM0106 family RecB-like putative nuclease [Candidatus Acidoferrum sp.]|nr:TM0106 family RecB-like putative nuclease [Candidatus Acidoferrum sp.]
MNFSATDLYGLFQPSQCDLRTWLRWQGEVESEPSEYDKILREMGQLHELQNLQSLGAYCHLGEGSISERSANTLEAIRRGENVLYQPTFESRVAVRGEECGLLGVPDFLIKSGPGYIIRDSKISRHADEERHYETILQLGLYGFLYEQCVGTPPAKLEVFLGDGRLEEVPYDGGRAALIQVERAYDIRKQAREFYEPVGWSKCNGCGFHERCWKQAEQNDELSRVYGIDQALARHLHLQGIVTVGDLLKNFNESSLGQIKLLRGTRETRVGLKAGDAILHASALQAGKLVLLKKPAVPASKNLVAFDIEGLPPQLDDLDKIYLWGLQVFGDRPSEYFAAVSDFGQDGDRAGWFVFLDTCKNIFASWGDIPFLHWTHYERTNLKKYVSRYGDPDGVAGRVESNLSDLFPVAKAALVLPEPTYSLKVVEKYAGFQRALSEANGQWSMATYIKAVETRDPDLRKKSMNLILDYNREDLQATWAVYRWLAGL